MSTTTIDQQADVVTLINVFTVEPDRQQELVDVLVEATDSVIQHRPGFISANIHVGLDGDRVTNYAQWRSVEDLAAMQRDPASGEHMGAAAAIASSFEPHLYRVASIHHR